MAAIADVDSRRLPSAAESVTNANRRKPWTTQDFRSLIDDDNCDRLLLLNQVPDKYDLTEKKWYTKYLPYSQYSSQLDLAKAIIANTEEFGFRPL